MTIFFRYIFPNYQLCFWVKGWKQKPVKSECLSRCFRCASKSLKPLHFRRSFMEIIYKREGGMWLNSDDLPITCRRLKIPVENRSLTGPVSSCSFERQHCTERCSTLLYNIRTIENNMNRKVRLKNCYPIWAERATAVCRNFRLSESLNLILCTALGANGEKYERNISSFFRSTLTIRWKKTTVNTTWCRTRPSVLGGRKSSVRLPQQRSSVCFWMVVTMELKEFSPVPVRSGGLAWRVFAASRFWSNSAATRLAPL